MAICYRSAARPSFWRYASTRILDIVGPTPDSLPLGPSDCEWLVPGSF
jgi:hypothetical protein